MPTIDARGRITLPKSMRDSLNLHPGEPLQFTQTSEGWMLHRIEEASADSSPTARRLGFMREQVQVPDDLGTMGSDEILRRFDGRR
ncbi:transcriptional regulator, AbrB family [compost metagenome]